MFDKIKRLGTDTAVYGVSTVVGRFLTFILTPFYTHLLTRDELGVVSTVYAYIAFLNIIYAYGMEAAFMRYVSSLEIGTKKQNFSVPFIAILLTSLVLTLLIGWQALPLASLSRVPLRYASIVSYSGWILFFDAAAIIPFALLRMERKAKLFAALKLWNIVITVILNLLFLVKYGWGVEGIFLGNLLASASTLLLLLPVILRNFTLEWNQPLFAALLRFGIPAIPSYIATMMIQVIDRPILESLTDLATVGVYQANYRLGIFMMLVVSMFDFAWRPFFLSSARDPDAKHLFSRVLTYFFAAMMAVFLLASMFVEDLVTTPIYHGASIIHPNYWSGLGIVPVILLAYVFLGISNVLVAGIYIEKQTKRLPLITFTGAATNIVANYALIPVLGILGAALATLVSYAVMAIVLYVIVQSIYPIRYEVERVAKIALTSAVVYLLFVFIKFDSLEILWKVFLLLLFGGLMYMMKVFTAAELSFLRRLVTRRARTSSVDDIPSPTNTPG